ncbi:AAA family ATPase [Enterobacter kobei]|nr:AAA family ATPase [Enterobacter kobei]UXJ65145.1 AAA family ATPase [Enterobacter kobei]
MLRKILHINNFAVFNNFSWNNSVRDEGNNVAELKKMNIFYGRNYSGKTTLSRIMRSLELYKVHDKYPNSEYSFEFTTGELISHDTLVNNSRNVRVYNRDFVQDNLKWLFNSDGDIKSFAILGERNIDIENKIVELKDIIGDNQKGLVCNYNLKNLEYNNKKREFQSTSENLENKLREKANRQIKTNHLYQKVTYNINSIEEDIKTILNNPIRDIPQEEQAKLVNLLSEKSKDFLLDKVTFSDKTLLLQTQANNLLSYEVKPDETIQDLINNSLLQEWVRSGINLHKGVRDTCAFCGGVIPHNLWEQLDSHFNKESEKLRGLINDLISDIDTVINTLPTSLPINQEQIYSLLHTDYFDVLSRFSKEIVLYDNFLMSMKNSLQERLKEIFTPMPSIIIEESYDLEAIYNSLESIRQAHNTKIRNLKSDQDAARNILRLTEVSQFITDINYIKEKEKISSLVNEYKTLEQEKNKIQEQINSFNTDIQNHLDQQRDESYGAEKINLFLKNHFGHNSLNLRPFNNTETHGVNFKIYRGDTLADNLSEGECSLVSFCYFMAKLGDVDSANKDLIIWIDDPISSLDNNHIFFIYSLIEDVLTRPIKNQGQRNSYKYHQIFISTHNLDFLKYIKRLSKPKDDANKESCGYFLLDRGETISTLKVMPKYLKKYITEFNYLFGQIYKCAYGNIEDNNHDSYYNFGNNLRKFLEAYLYYKYPNNKPNDEKLYLFFDNNQLAVDIANRVNNELSHLEEIFDRSMLPVDVPAFKKLAIFVLDTIQRKDPEQYQALVDSM